MAALSWCYGPAGLKGPLQSPAPVDAFGDSAGRGSSEPASFSLDSGGTWSNPTQGIVIGATVGFSDLSTDSGSTRQIASGRPATEAKRGALRRRARERMTERGSSIVEIVARSRGAQSPSMASIGCGRRPMDGRRAPTCGLRRHPDGSQATCLRDVQTRRLRSTNSAERGRVDQPITNELCRTVRTSAERIALSVCRSRKGISRRTVDAGRLHDRPIHVSTDDSLFGPNRSEEPVRRDASWKATV